MIKEILKELPPADRAVIMQHFNEAEYYLHDLGNGRFLTVHGEPKYPFTVIEQSSFWLLGESNVKS